MSTLINGKSALLLAVLSLIFISATQNLNAQNNSHNTQTIIAKDWINWIGVFKPGVDSVTRQAFLENLKGQIAGASKTPVNGQMAQKGQVCKYLTNYAKNEKVFNVKEIRTEVCPDNNCDRFHIFADIEAIGVTTISVNNGVADSISQPGTKPPPPPRLQGKLLAVLDSITQPGTKPPRPPRLEGKLLTIPDTFAQNESKVVQSDQFTRILNSMVLQYPHNTKNVIIGGLTFRIYELGHYSNSSEYLNSINVLNALHPSGILQVTQGEQVY